MHTEHTLDSSIDSSMTPTKTDRACTSGKSAPIGAAHYPVLAPANADSDSSILLAHPVGIRGERGVKRSRPGSRKRTIHHRNSGTNKNGFLGIKWVDRSQSFQANIRDNKSGNGKKIYCGSAKTAEEAAKLYDAMSRLIYGKGAVTNFAKNGTPAVRDNA